MRRRNFITLLGGVAVAWPLAARGQQAVTPVIGYLSSGSPAQFAALAAAFRQGLSETGFVEGRNVAIEYRWAEDHLDRLPAMATDLIHRGVAVIAATGGSAPAIAAKAATATTPIVFTGGGDPVGLGLVASLSHPTGNATGTTNITRALDAKRLELLHELVPGATVVGVLMNPDNGSAAIALTNLEEAALTLALTLYPISVRSEREFEPALTEFIRHGTNALLVAADALFTNRRDRLVELVARFALPANYSFREFVMAGGLVSYGPSVTDGYHQAGIYAGRILKGEKPGDLPVQAPTKFELAINLRTAKALGLTVPPTLLARADEVIE